MEQIKDRVIGSLVGLAVGDALGTTIEFMERDTYEPIVDIVGGGPFRLNPGDWTDDTSMALCLAESLIVNRNLLDPAHLLSLFYEWYNKGYNSVKGYCFDIGGTTATGITRWHRHGTTRHNEQDSSAGNGGIMRLAPAAMIGYRDIDHASYVAVRQSATTHASAECLDSADFMARYMVSLYNGEDVRPYHPNWRESVRTIATRNYLGVSRDTIKSTGYVIDTLEAAVWAVANSNSFADAVLLAVNLGHDSDTVGAVTGQLAGAKWGLSSIPEAWLDKLTEKDLILELATELYRIG